jgi:hypothetical protein
MPVDERVTSHLYCIVGSPDECNSLSLSLTGSRATTGSESKCQEDICRQREDVGAWTALQRRGLHGLPMTES